MRSIFLITFFFATAIAADPGAQMSLQESIEHCKPLSEAQCKNDDICLPLEGMNKAFEGLLCLLI